MLDSVKILKTGRAVILLIGVIWGQPSSSLADETDFMITVDLNKLYQDIKGLFLSIDDSEASMASRAYCYEIIAHFADLAAEKREFAQLATQIALATEAGRFPEGQLRRAEGILSSMNSQLDSIKSDLSALSPNWVVPNLSTFDAMRASYSEKSFLLDEFEQKMASNQLEDYREIARLANEEANRLRRITHELAVVMVEVAARP